MLKDLLLRLEAVVESQRMPLRGHFAPARGQQAIAERLIALGLYPRREVLEVFQWHDGMKASAPPGFITPRELGLVTLKTAVRQYQSVISKAPDEIRAPGWFPVFSYGDGYVVVNCMDSDTDDAAAALWSTWHGGMQDHIAVPSLRDPLDWWVSALERGVWRWSPDDYAWIDTVRYEDCTVVQRESHLF